MWRLAIVLTTLFFQGSAAIECYSCYVKSPPRAPGSSPPIFERLCSRFDQSDQYLVNCTHSTLCMTRTFTLQHRQEFSSDRVVIIERGCAMQAYEHQALVRGKWRTIINIMEEAYSPGCVTDREWAGSLASDTEYCYCDQDRCNDKMADEEQLKVVQNETNISENSLQHNEGFFQYTNPEHGEMRSGQEKLEHSSIVKYLIMLLIVCIK